MADEVKVYDQSDIEANRTMCILMAIFPILFFLVFCVDSMKDSPYSKFKANQSLLLVFMSIICGIIPVLGWICYIVEFVFWILNLVATVNNEAKPLPLFGDKLTIIK